MRTPPNAARRVLPDAKRRDALIAVGAGVLVLAFVLYAVFLLGKQANSTGGVEGVVVGKEFVPRPETQITVGQGGVHRRELAGEYQLRVRVPAEGGKVYKVTVNPAVYGTRRVGDPFYFFEPKD